MLKATATFVPRPGAIEQITGRVAQAVTLSTLKTAEDVLSIAQGIVPVDTGDLRDSGHTEAVREAAAASAAVVFDSDHAVFVEYGTGQRDAASSGAGPGPYSSTWAGMEAQPFLRPSFEQKRLTIEGDVKAAVEQALR